MKAKRPKQRVTDDFAIAISQPEPPVAKEVEEVKEAEREPATPSVASTSASSVDSDDSDAGDASASPMPSSTNSTFAATAPPTTLPVVSPSQEDSSLTTQRATFSALAPPTFPLPQPYAPPTSPSSLTLSVYIGTWNLHGKLPPPSSSLSHFLPSNALHDLLVIGTEECDMSIERAVLMSPVSGGRKDKWVKRVWEEVGVGEYDKVEEEGMVAMHVVVFVRKRLAHLVTGVERGKVATGVGDMLGNKGGVAIGMSVGATSFLFVCSHFAAHQHRVDERNADFHKINSRLTLRSKPTPPTPSSSSNPSTTAPTPSPPPAPLACDRFERVFWLGDLNYRIEGSYTLVTHLIRSGMMEPLLHNDQLRQQRAQGKVFAGFHEREIGFRPTYKVDAGSEPVVYDSSKKRRVPGWTDRVLWKDVEGGAGVECVQYVSVEQVRSSDHFPVKAVFNVRVDGVVDVKAVEETKESPQSKAAEEDNSAAVTQPPPPTDAAPAEGETEGDTKNEDKSKSGKKDKVKAKKEKKVKQAEVVDEADGKEEEVSVVKRKSVSASTQTDAGEARVTRAGRGSTIDMAIADDSEAALGAKGRPEATAAADSLSRDIDCQPLATEKDSQVCAIQ